MTPVFSKATSDGPRGDNSDYFKTLHLNLNAPRSLLKQLDTPHFDPVR